jgi:hypothetical protein
MIVSSSLYRAQALNAQQALQVIEALSSNAKTAVSARPAGGLHPSSSFGRSTSSTIAAIQDLTSKVSVSPEQDAIGRVKQWVKDGTFRNAANGLDDANLQQMAKDGKLGNLPPFTSEQENTMNSAELRVYVEARFMQAFYNTQPHTLENAKANFIKQSLSSLPEAINRISSDINSGVLDDTAGNWSSQVTEMETQLAAVRSGKIRIETLDSSFYSGNREIILTRGAGGLVIGGGSGGVTISDELSRQYAGKGISFGSSEYFGGFAISW